MLHSMEKWERAQKVSLFITEPTLNHLSTVAIILRVSIFQICQGTDWDRRLKITLRIYRAGYAQPAATAA